MEGFVPLFLFAAVLLSRPGWVSTLKDCPWEQNGLLLWSDASTWDGAVPVEDDLVQISVLLDFHGYFSARELNVLLYPKRVSLLSLIHI